MIARRMLTNWGSGFSNVIIRRAIKTENTGVLSHKTHKMGMKISLIGEN